MCFFEYDWMVGVWKFRIGDHFTDFRGQRSWETLAEVKADMKANGLTLVKTDSRTYKLIDARTNSA